MKNLDLNNFGVQEMNEKELMVAEGGNPLVAFAVGYILIEAAMNPISHYNAFIAGWKSLK